MTDIRKPAKENAKKAKKLHLNKETIADLDIAKTSGGNVKGGVRPPPEKCTYNYSMCTDAGE